MIYIGKNQHITPNGNGLWQVIGAGNSKATKLFETQAQAIKYGKNIAQNQKSELLIHGRNGKIRSKDSYGNDNCPPKDTEH